MSDTIVTAAMLVIGDEILSGRTREANAHHLARMLTATGIDLREVRVVADDTDAIIEAVNALRARNDHVFTSGGIGPTHDDITAEAIARAFGLSFGPHAQAMAILTAHYARLGQEFTDARKRMGMMPEGAALIDNPVTAAPGFIVDNVHVMAGVPSIFQAMLDNVLPGLRAGRRLHSASIDTGFGEGDIGGPLADIQNAHPQTMIGSYPRFSGDRHVAQIVVRAGDEADLAAAVDDVKAMLERMASGQW